MKLFSLKKDMPEDLAHVLRIKGAREDRTRSPSNYSGLSLLGGQLQRKLRNYLLKGLRCGVPKHTAGLCKETILQVPELKHLGCLYMRYPDGTTIARKTLPSSSAVFWPSK